MAGIAEKVASTWMRGILRRRGSSARRGAEGGMGIFESPSQAQRAQPGAGMGIFESLPKAPSGRPQAPSQPPGRPQAPEAPAGRQGPDRGALRALKRDRDFQQFLREKYQGGEQKVTHPLPRLRRRYRDGIKFWTAMKYPQFHDAVIRAFETWKQQQQAEDGAGRDAWVGGDVGDPSKLRVGDVIQARRRGAPKHRVVGLDANGNVVTSHLGREGHGRDRVPRRALANFKFVEVAGPDAELLQQQRHAPQTEGPQQRRPPQTEGPVDTMRLPAPRRWRERDARLLKFIEEGQKTGRDERLGTSSANGAYRRKLKLGDQVREFVWKSRGDENPQYRIGIPDLASREQAVYEVDALIGDGRVVPPTKAVDSAEGAEEQGGVYQAMIPDAEDLIDAGEDLRDISTEDFIRHPDVQRITVLDVLVGHEDRHVGNVMFTKIDVAGPLDADNLRFHAIDNGYAFAESKHKRVDSSFDIRDPWPGTGGSIRQFADRTRIQKKILSHIPEQVHEKLKGVRMEDFLEKLVESGIKDQSALLAAAVRLAALQANPAVLGALMEDLSRGRRPSIGPRQTQRQFQYLSHKDPAKLLREHTDLPADEVTRLLRKVQDALA